jgi:hypothetical protein
MGKYGEAAVHATGFLASQIDCPNEAWRKAVSEVFPESVSSQKKSCPKSAYLGLCEAGVIAGVPKSDYTRSTDNKRYALEAMSILVSSPVLATDHKTLWSKTSGADKKHNGQMDVVTSLWLAGLLVNSTVG